jgi:hypothetical protein
VNGCYQLIIAEGEGAAAFFQQFAGGGGHGQCLLLQVGGEPSDQFKGKVLPHDPDPLILLDLALDALSPRT